MSALQPKLLNEHNTRILYQDATSSIQQNASIGIDPDIEDEGVRYFNAQVNSDMNDKEEEDGEVKVVRGV